MIVVFLASFILILLAVLGMAVGVLCGRGCIRGTCGGLSDGTVLRGFDPCLGCREARRETADGAGRKSR